MGRVAGCKSCWPYYRKPVPVVQDGNLERCAVCGRVLCVRYSDISVTVRLRPTARKRGKS